MVTLSAVPTRAHPPAVTLADIATEAGVAISTASLAMRMDRRVAPHTRNRVIAAAERLGYAGPQEAARALRRGRSDTVAVVYVGRFDDVFGAPQRLAALSELIEAMTARGKSVLVSPASSAMSISRRSVDLAIIVGAESQIEEQLRHHGTRTIRIDLSKELHLERIV